MKFSDFLKQLRTDAGYTQQDIADLLGINRSTYAYYECGKTEPAIRHLKKLSELYKLHMEELVGCRYRPTHLSLGTAEPETADTSDAQKFQYLDRTEQQLVLLYRSVRDKQAFLRHIRSFEETEE